LVVIIPNFFKVLDRTGGIFSILGLLISFLFILGLLIPFLNFVGAFWRLFYYSLKFGKPSWAFGWVNPRIFFPAKGGFHILPFDLGFDPFKAESFPIRPGFPNLGCFQVLVLTSPLVIFPEFSRTPSFGGQVSRRASFSLGCSSHHSY